MGPQLEHLGQHGEGAGVALVAHDAGVLVLHLAAALAELGEQHGDGLQDVERLEAGRHQRLAVLLGHEPVGPVADHRRDVAGPEEAVEAEVGRFEDGLDRRDDRDVVAEDREVA